MNTKLRIFGTLVATAMAWTAAPQAGAAFVYRNTQNPFVPPAIIPIASGPAGPVLTNLAVGNQFIMAGCTAEKTSVSLERFRVSYWSSQGVDLPGQESTWITAQLFFYANDGLPYGPGGPLRPGTPLWTSSTFQLPPTPMSVPPDWEYGSILAGQSYGDWSPGGMVLPHEFTWAVQFTGLTGTNQAGLEYNGPPTIGTNACPECYWMQFASGSGTDWETRTNNTAGVLMEFAADFSGEMVPEPSPVLYGAVLCAGLGVWVVRRRTQRAALAK